MDEAPKGPRAEVLAPMAAETSCRLEDEACHSRDTERGHRVSARLSLHSVLHIPCGRMSRWCCVRVVVGG
jgi:hypothetical protein